MDNSGFQALLEAQRQKAFYDAGGKDPGNSNYDQFTKGFGAVQNIGNAYLGARKAHEDIITSALARKANQLKISAGEREMTPASQIPQNQFTLGEQKTQAEIEALKARANIQKDLIPVNALPEEARARAIAAGFPEDGMIDIKKFNALKMTDPYALVGAMSPEAGLEAKQIPGNARIIDPRGMGIGNLSPGMQQAAFKLRDDFRADSTDFIKKRNSYNNVISSARDAETTGEGASDLALIYAFTKLQDPTMVTEQEIQNAINTGRFSERVKAAFNKVLAGGKLTPEIRNDFVNTAKKLYDESLAQQKDLTEQYKITGKGLGIPANLFITNYESMESRKPQTNQPKEIYATNPSNNARIKSIDGGKTWQLAPPK